MVAAHHVPNEVIEEIVSRVPVKSLLRFKSASQKLYSLLSKDYEFAKFHLKRSKNHHRRLVFFKLLYPNHNSFLSLNMDNNASRKFKFPVEFGVDLVGSANGLIIKCSYRVQHKAFHWNGALHWCLAEKIAAFDLAKEVFTYIELPDEMKRIDYRFPQSHSVLVTMWEFNGCLCISWTKDIWMMLKYGDSKSWIKLTTYLAGRDQKPLGMSTIGEILYMTRNASGFVKSDIQGRMLNDDESLLRSPYPPGHSYFESLISPKCFDALHPQSKKTIRRKRKQRKNNAT